MHQAKGSSGVQTAFGEGVAEGALAGDSACMQIMDRARRALAAGCVSFVNTFNPHRIVIGGSVAEAEGERLLQPIRDAIASEAFQVVAEKVTIVPAGLGGDVSLAGAQPLVMRRLDGLRTVDATRDSPGGPTGANDRARRKAPAHQPATTANPAAASAAAIPGGTPR